jgi:hypothetical protein
VDLRPGGGLLAAVVDQGDDLLLSRVALRLRPEDADFAGGAVVNLHAVANGKNHVGRAEALHVLVKALFRGQRPVRLGLLVGHEDFIARSAQPDGLLADPLTLVGLK